ncbi:MAG TPA: LLM class flavin-dependent oxidoreductase [Chloroflexota bacterium]|jgi:5,10-methylenetetrahydromethanopterin reductase
MDFGISLPPVADTWKLVKRAEELAFARAWFYDTQMLNSELFVSMTAAALNTTKIRLATGVMIPSNRIAPVAASGLATLNALAPGRIDFGVSTGFTARRSLGLRAVKQADLEEYIRVVGGLLAGETLEWDFEGKRRKISFLDPDIGAVNIKDPIPLHISAFGPKGRRLVARLGAGWIGSVPNVSYGQAAIAEMQTAWTEAGNDPAALHATAAMSGCVLEEGEAYDSPRAKAQAGPHAMVVLHGLAEHEEFGDSHRRPLPPELAPLAERYRAIYSRYEPADARYLSNHRGHLMYLRPEEHQLCTADLIRMGTFTAPKAELVERLRALKAAGFKHVTLNCGYGHPERLDEWASVFHDV